MHSSQHHVIQLVVESDIYIYIYGVHIYIVKMEITEREVAFDNHPFVIWQDIFCTFAVVCICVCVTL